jgi:SpoIIAA-like
VGATTRTLLPEHPVIEARYFGKVTREDFERAFAECLELATIHGIWHLLADCTDQLWSAEITYLKGLADDLAAVGLPPTFREALVQPVDVNARVYVRYWATAGANRGLTMEMFRTREEALAWLTTEDEHAV